MMLDILVSQSLNPYRAERTIWWIITKSFGHRARDEARQLKFGDIKLQKEFNVDRKYLVWDTERSTKTRNGETPHGHQRSFEPKAFAIKDSPRCPVFIYKEFLSRRPITMLREDSPFFLGVKQNYSDSQIWYTERPLGKNSIAEFLSQSRKFLPANNCGGKKIANHSARKTLSRNFLMQISILNMCSS